MATTTITLERSAYELLKANKRPGESFSEEVQRVLGPGRPRLSSILELISKDDAMAIGKVIGQIRDEDESVERERLKRGSTHHGRGN